MAEIKALERMPLSAWQVEGLRMTVFLSPAAQVPAIQTWWENLVGEPPETQNTLPRQKVWREEGPFERGKLAVTVQLPRRIDWHYLATDDSGWGQQGLPTLGTFPEVITSFSQLMIRWFQSDACSSVQRLAFGSTLVQPVDNRQSGYQQIAAYLPHFSLNLEGASDFFLQINRPRPSTSGIPNLRVNRLSKWSVSMWTITEIPATPEMELRVRQGGALCRLELDINTAPDFPGDLPRERLSQIFEELVSLGQEIAREGDIP